MKITPAYLFEYALAKTLFVIFANMPLRWASAIGGGLGYFIASLPAKKNQTTRDRIKHAYGKALNEQTVRQIQCGSAVSLVKTITEFPNIYSLNKKGFDKHVKITGLDILKEHKDALVLTAHYGNWEIILKMAGIHKIPMANVYRRANNPLTDKLITEMRAQPEGLQIPKGKKGGRDLIKSLKEGLCVGFLNDQKLNDGIKAPFFGHEVMTAPSLAEMAVRYNRPVVPIFCTRTPNEEHLFEVVISEPLELKESENKTKDIAENTALFNKMIEKQIRKNPGQWMWYHRRF